MGFALWCTESIRRGLFSDCLTCSGVVAREQAMSHPKGGAKAGGDSKGGGDAGSERAKKVLPNRVADYFAIVGVNDEPTAAEAKRRFGGGNKLPIKVLDRYPKEDHKDAEFPKDLPLVST